MREWVGGWVSEWVGGWIDRQTVETAQLSLVVIV